MPPASYDISQDSCPRHHSEQHTLTFSETPATQTALQCARFEQVFAQMGRKVPKSGSSGRMPCQQPSLERPQLWHELGRSQRHCTLSARVFSKLSTFYDRLRSPSGKFYILPPVSQRISIITGLDCTTRCNHRETGWQQASEEKSLLGALMERQSSIFQNTPLQ